MCWNIGVDITIYGDDRENLSWTPGYWQRKMALVVDGVSGGDGAVNTWYRLEHQPQNYLHAQLYPNSFDWHDGIFLQNDFYVLEVYCWQASVDLLTPARLRVVATRESDSAQIDTGVLSFLGYTDWVDNIYISSNAWGGGPNYFGCYYIKQDII